MSILIINAKALPALRLISERLRFMDGNISHNICGLASAFL